VLAQNLCCWLAIHGTSHILLWIYSWSQSVAPSSVLFFFSCSGSLFETHTKKHMLMIKRSLTELYIYIYIYYKSKDASDSSGKWCWFYGNNGEKAIVIHHLFSLISSSSDCILCRVIKVVKCDHAGQQHIFLRGHTLYSYPSFYFLWFPDTPLFSKIQLK